MSAYVDANLVDVHIELAACADGQLDNAATLLVRADQLRSDESGVHPGERFAVATVRRKELLGILQALEDDWQDHCRLADPFADARPLVTNQVRGRVDVLLSLLEQCSEVLATIEPESDEETRAMRTLLDHMTSAADEWRQPHG